MRTASIVSGLFLLGLALYVWSLWVEAQRPPTMFKPTPGWRGVPGFREDGRKDPAHPRWRQGD